jgi:predicted RNase H-like HicB family nuclease
MRYYIALVRKDADTSFGVEFPDFPGCISAGDTLDEAAQGAAEALAFHVEGMLQDGDPIPEPSSFEDIDVDGAVPMLVPLADGRGRVVRLNITMDENLLEEVDSAARRFGQSRSAFLANAARKAL